MGLRHLTENDIGVNVEGIYGENREIYLENTEWNTSSGAATFDFASANDPHTGSVSIETTADMGASNYISFDNVDNISLGLGAQLKLWFKCKVLMNVAGGALNLQWYKDGLPIGIPVQIFGSPAATYGLDGGNIVSYQEGTIPVDDFFLTSQVDELRIESPVGISQRQFFLDDITIVAASNPNTKWFPTALTLGDFAANGVSTFTAIGAGYLYTFNNNADDELIGNVALDRNGDLYDGSPIMLALIWQIFTAPAGGNNVLWELDYAFTNDDDDNYTAIDGTVVLNVDVSARTERQQYYDLMPEISGAAGARNLQLTLRRNGSGAGSDNYGGDADVYAIDLKV